MTQDPRVRSEMTDEEPLRDQQPAGQATAFFSEPPKLTQVAQTLAAHGGGALSVDLAFDLVLNEVVEQARNATGASGGAIALFRDGELVCRATTGENAPDLGVRVDVASGLAGACVSTGEIQQCRDTDSDTRVNAETCRRLGVRSMLIAPLVDAQRMIGIIQVFSAWPNAFGKREISALQVLAGRIAESNREAEAGLPVPGPDESTPTPEPTMIPAQPIPAEESRGISVEEGNGKGTIDFWGTLLVVLVIAAAVSLGLVIGWRRTAPNMTREPQIRETRPVPNSSAGTEASEEPSLRKAPDSERIPPSTPADVSMSKAAAPTVSTPPPSGGLVVTQNGRVVYRSPAESVRPPRAPVPAQRSLIHRVEPEYPSEARARNVQGSVVLDVQVLASGDVGNIAVVSGDPLLAQSAIQAVRQWRYQPQSVKGQGIESQTRITVRFTLPSS